MAQQDRSRERITEVTTPAIYTINVKHRDEHGVLTSEYHDDQSGPWSYASQSQYCYDNVGFRYVDNPLYISNERYVPARVFFQITNTAYNPFGSAETSISHDRPSDFGHAIYSEDSQVSDIEFVTKAVAGTNPSKADFQSLVFLAEMRDLPRLFESVGSNMAKYGANEYLKFQYGWTPLIRDIRKFFDVAEAIDKRLQVIKRLDDKGVLRRKYDPKGVDVVPEHAEYIGDNPHIFTPTGTITNHLYTTMYVKRWAIVEWTQKPPSTVFSASDRTQYDRARSAVYGANVDGPSFWQAMPWSWFIDWSTNMSEYIASQNNVVGAEATKVVLMKTTRIDTTCYPVWLEEDTSNGPRSFTFIPGKLSSVYKERILDIMPEAIQTKEMHIITDSNFKMSILGALGIQRLRF